MKVLKQLLSATGGPEDKEKKKFIIVSLILIGLFVGLYLVQRTQELRRKAQQVGVDLSLIPSATEILPDEQFSVEVVMNTNEFSVSAVEIHVSFDSNYLEATSISAKNYLPVVLPPGPQVGVGRASIILGSLPSDPKKGTGVLATINFKAKQAAVTSTEIMFATGTQIAAIGHTGDVTGTLTPTSVAIGGLDVASIRLSPASDVNAIGTSFPVEIVFSTGKSGKKVSSITSRVTFDYSGGSPELEVVDANGNLSNKIIPDATLDAGDWDFPVNSVTRTSGKVTIDLAAINTSTGGFSSEQEVTLATIYFKGVREPTVNPILISFDMTETKMLTKEDPPQDILEKASGGSYFVGAGATLNFGFRAQGISGVCSQSMTIRLLGDAVEKSETISVKSDDTGVFRPTSPVVITDLPLSTEGTNYEVFVKGPSHLRKKLGNILLKPGVNNAPASWESQVMKVGDFDDVTSSGYNVLDILDVGKILSIYTVLETPANAANRNFDVDCSNTINIFDIALVLTNYTALQIFGD